MCGIAGIVEFGQNPIEPGQLLDMSSAMAHRGPDDEGYVLVDPIAARYQSFSGPTSPREICEQLPMISGRDHVAGATIGLCHRRFSIIDLSAAGHQPFFDHERSCCIVFNGEIYNYLEIRQELEGHGIIFSTHSDTEVLIESYKYWGTECFARLNGFWAIALYDFRNRRLVLSRDRIGKKPLYWSKEGSRLYFASEIKALLQIPQISEHRSVNEESIYRWLAYGRKDLDSSTCFEGIHSLPAASWTVANREFPNNCQTFWRLSKERLSEKDVSAADTTKALRELLQDSVSIRLRADVPVSVELSGGLDSSTLVGLASQSRPQGVTTYTVRFPDKEWDEEPFARSVAQHCGSDYKVLDSPIDNFWSQALLFTRLEEEPYHSPNLQTNQAVWSQMRSFGTKVSLNGAGGDETFAGYGQYFELSQAENLIEGRFLAYLNNGLRYSAGRTHLRSLIGPMLKLAKNALRGLTIPHSESTVPHFRGRGSRTASLYPRTLSEAIYADMTNTLMPYWLRSGDRGYMGVPLEVRAPFLDYRVIEFAFRLPITYLIRDGWHKWILRKAVEDILPADVVWRRRKMGFPFPYERFYRESSDIVDLIVNQSHNPYIDFSRKDRFRNDWKTLSFILWYELFFNENLDLFRRIQEKAQTPRSEQRSFTPMFLQCPAPSR
jgi:asparagine synthase (glutamine-hydrolysing)